MNPKSKKPSSTHPVFIAQSCFNLGSVKSNLPLKKKVPSTWIIPFSKSLITMVMAWSKKKTQNPWLSRSRKGKRATSTRPCCQRQGKNNFPGWNGWVFVPLPNTRIGCKVNSVFDVCIFLSGYIYIYYIYIDICICLTCMFEWPLLWFKKKCCFKGLTYQKNRLGLYVNKHMIYILYIYNMICSS